MRPSRLSGTILMTVLVGVLFTAFNNCDIQTPSVAIGSYTSVGYTHTGQEVSCAGCHEPDRPPIANSILHGNGADCVSCHTSTNSPVGTADVVWTSTQTPYTHATSGITSCLNCHTPNEPAPVNGFVHYANSDCVMCHSPNGNNTNGLTLDQIESAFITSYAYTHPTGLTSCEGCHEKDRYNAQHNPGQDCVSCHGTNNTWTSTMTLSQIQAIWLSTSPSP
jgi:hypothetical protein